jgi:hypothetical protein
MKPKKEKTNLRQNEQDLNSTSPEKGTGKTSEKLITNTDEQKKKTNNDDDGDPENKPVKLPNKQDKPATDPGNPDMKSGEKEKTKGKIPVTHPGNKQ